MTDTETIHQFAKQNLLVEKYLLSELTGADLEDFEQHLFECSICFEEVKAGQEFRQGIKAGVSSEGLHRKSLWQRIKDFWEARWMIQSMFFIFVQLGPMPQPPPPENYRCEFEFWAGAFLCLVALMLLALVVFVLLLSYSERFSDFWERFLKHGVGYATNGERR